MLYCHAQVSNIKDIQFAEYSVTLSQSVFTVMLYSPAGEFEEYPDDDSDSGSELVGGSATEDLILPALRYLQRCCAILSSMWKMPACPVFNDAHR